MIFNVENILLKSANDDDDKFLREVFFDSRRVELEFSGLPLEQINSLLSMQYAAQKQSYKASFPNSHQFIVKIDNKKAGQLLINSEQTAVKIIDIAVLSDFRGKGIGSFLLEKLKSDYEMINLMVFKMNFGAIRLYEKHGFIVTADTGSYLEMEWKNVG